MTSENATPPDDAAIRCQACKRRIWAARSLRRGTGPVCHRATRHLLAVAAK